MTNKRYESFNALPVSFSEQPKIFSEEKNYDYLSNPSHNTGSPEKNTLFKEKALHAVGRAGL